jgi:hypothetical protein
LHQFRFADSYKKIGASKVGALARRTRNVTYGCALDLRFAPSDTSFACWLSSPS